MRFSRIIAYLFLFIFLVSAASFSTAYPTLSLRYISRDFRPNVYLSLVDDCEENIVDVQPVLAYVFVDGAVYGNSTLMFEVDRFLDVDVPEDANVSIQVFSKSRFWSNRVSVPSNRLFPRSSEGVVSSVRFVLSYTSESGCPILTSTSSTTMPATSSSTTMPAPVPEDGKKFPAATLIGFIIIVVVVYSLLGRFKGGSGKEAGGLRGASK